MTHLPYILASYVLFAVVAVVLAVTAGARLRSAMKRLRVVDKRADRRES